MKKKLKKTLDFIYYATIYIAVFCAILVVFSPFIGLITAPIYVAYKYNNYNHFFVYIFVAPLIYALARSIHGFIKGNDF